MAKLYLKKASKRVSTRKRVKIQKKVNQHNKKKRREEKKSGNKVFHKKKDAHVPNSFPLKEEVLREAERRKKRLEEEREQKKEARKVERQKTLAKKRSLDSLVKDASKRTEDFEKKAEFVAETSKKFSGGKALEISLKQYYKEFKKVVDAADVIIEVLDARDPLGSRCIQVEEAVLSSGANKKLVLMLNKIDLVPRENVEQWLKYLRNEFPTVAFKASTQTQKDNLSQSRVPLSKASQDLLKSSACLGADVLMTLLGNYCRNQDIKTAITVGVVGFPNTGKSSVINSLKRAKACSVGATPGVTKQLQEVQLDKHVKLLDCPGIVMATGNSDSATILRNCVKVETVDDPVPPVSAILRRCDKKQLMMHYSLPDFSDVHAFLALLAKRFGRLKKKGVPDVVKAGKQILQDWNLGKIRYYTHPPEQHTMPTHLSAEIVSTMSKEFNIEALHNDEVNTLKGLKGAQNSDFVIPASEPTPGLTAEMDVQEEEEEEEEEELDEEGDDETHEAMEEDKEEKSQEDLADTTVSVGKKKKKLHKSPSEKKKMKILKEDTLSDNMQLNKARKVAFKKLKKQRKRADALGDDLGSTLTGALASLGSKMDDNYDFSVDFK